MNEIKTWVHNRKGKITGIVVSDGEVFIDIKLIGDQAIQYMNGKAIEPDGEIITVRKSLLYELPAAPPQPEKGA